jgi:hypothetical protein
MESPSVAKNRSNVDTYVSWTWVSFLFHLLACSNIMDLLDLDLVCARPWSFVDKKRLKYNYGLFACIKCDTCVISSGLHRSVFAILISLCSDYGLTMECLYYLGLFVIIVHAKKVIKNLHTLCLKQMYLVMEFHGPQWIAICHF